MANHENSHGANTLTAIPDFELVGRLQDYPFAERVEVLRKHNLAGFIATGHSEINDAFAALLDHDTRGQQTDGRLAAIGEHVRRTAPTGDQMARAGRTIARITSNHGAYLEQANRDKRWLRFMRGQMLERLEYGEQYGSLAEYVGATGTEPYAGPGQLVRYIDAARLVLHDPAADSRFTFGAKLSKNSSAKSVVSDVFATPHPVPAVAEYERQVLAEIPMTKAAALIGYAIGNEIRRQNFWERDLYEATRQEVARPVASAALGNLSA